MSCFSWCHNCPGLFPLPSVIGITSSLASSSLILQVTLQLAAPHSRGLLLTFQKTPLPQGKEKLDSSVPALGSIRIFLHIQHLLWISPPPPPALLAPPTFSRHPKVPSL